MKPALQVRQTQQLKLTAQLHQSFHLLQISTVDLDQEIEHAVDANPFLERLDDQWRDTVSLSPDSSLHYPAAADGDWPAGQPVAPATAADDAETATLATDADEGHTEYAAADTEDSPWGTESPSSGPRPEGDDDAVGDTFVPGESLHEHLREQLRGTLCPPRLRQLADILIEEIDERGYLVTPLAELHAELLAGDDVEPGELEQALAILQGFDPTGVGARDLAECLWLQLQELAGEHADDAAVIELASRITRDDLLPMVASNEFDKLCKRLRCPEARLSEALKLIRRLDPRPGNRYSAEPPAYVRPDVIVRRRPHGWQAVLNGHVVPELRVNPEYARLFKNHQSTKTSSPSPATQAQSIQADSPSGTAAPPPVASGTPPVDDSLGRQLQEAQWMVKNVQQRFETILRVSQAIVDRQQAFFERGALGMQPLVLREIADAVGLSESTISRATTQKYMATPHGVFELKHFFGSHVATESGGAISSTAIRELIRQFIDQEAPNQPLSDNQLTELLGQRGILVARRTVAKYRESLGKLPAAQRKIR